MTQQEKALRFKSLHKRGAPLVLYNIWDAGGAKALAEAGAPAVATGSWSVAAAHGYDDGEAIPLDFLLHIVERTACSVELPLSVDFEGGYAEKPEAVAANVGRVLQAGAIGINFEDRIVQGEGLYPIATQVERIAAIREAARRADVPLFINARTDLFLGSDPATHEGLVPQAIEREAAYAKAGADGFFIPGLVARGAIRDIVSAVSLPVNVMMMGELVSISDVSELGVSRASYGPGPFIAAAADLSGRYKSLT